MVIWLFATVLLRWCVGYACFGCLIVDVGVVVLLLLVIYCCLFVDCVLFVYLTWWFGFGCFCWWPLSCLTLYLWFCDDYWLKLWFVCLYVAAFHVCLV